MRRLALGIWVATALQSLAPSQMTWTEEPSPGLARKAADLAYDSVRDVFVLFGGEDLSYPPVPLVSTWEWDGVSWTEVDDGSGAHPSPRETPNVVFDPIRGVTMVVGGANPSQSSDIRSDCWTWDGSAWTQVADFPSPLTPDVWADIRATFDPITGAVLAIAETWPFFGPLSRETFTWDGTVWTRVHTGGLAVGDMVFEANLGRVVIPADGVHHEWDGTTWTQVGVPSSPNLLRARVAYDEARGRLVRFGGSLQAGPLFVGFNPDVYEFDGTSWTATTAMATGREGAALAYNASTGLLVMFGGRTMLSGPRSEMWAWNGLIAWVVDEGTGPAANFGSHALVYDEARDEVVQYGGDDGLTWTRQNGTWSIADSAGGPGNYGSMVYDAINQRVLRFQSPSLTGQPSELWSWNGSSWQLQPALQPLPNVYDFAMAFDNNRGVLVLHGGRPPGTIQPVGQTWEWDGTNWTLLPQLPQPGAVYDAAMAYDPNLEAIVMAGGSLGNGGLVSDFVWTWDGSNWALMNDRIPPRTEAGMVFDRNRQRMVLHSGYDDYITLRRDTYEWSGSGPWVERALDLTPTIGSAIGMVSDATDVFTVINGQVKLYRPTIASSGTSLGGGCSTGTMLSLQPNRPAILSTPNFALEVDGLTPGASGFVGLSFVPGAGIPFGGCELHLLGPWAFTGMIQADGNGQAVLPLNLTPTTAAGITATVQAGELSPGGALLGVLNLSNGYRFTVGD